jgi:hypothetical protein
MVDIPDTPADQLINPPGALETSDCLDDELFGPMLRRGDRAAASGGMTTAQQQLPPTRCVDKDPYGLWPQARPTAGGKPASPLPTREKMVAEFDADRMPISDGPQQSIRRRKPWLDIADQHPARK